MPVHEADLRVIGVLRAIVVRDADELQRLTGLSGKRLRTSIRRLRYAGKMAFDGYRLAPSMLMATTAEVAAAADPLPIRSRERDEDGPDDDGADIVAAAAAMEGEASPAPVAPVAPSGRGTFGTPWRDRAAALLGTDIRDRLEIAARAAGTTPWALLRRVVDRGIDAPLRKGRQD